MAEAEVTTIAELEDTVFKIEGVRIVFRAPADYECKPYAFKTPLNVQARVEHLMHRVGMSTKAPFIIVDGTANTVHEKTRTIRNLVMSYKSF